MTLLPSSRPSARCATAQRRWQHRDVGKGMKLRDLRSPDVQKQTDAELYTIICCGKGKMPGYQGKLTDDQIKQQVAYIRSLAKQ